VTSTTSSAPDLPRYAEELAEEIEDLRHVPELSRPEEDLDRFIDRESSWLDFNLRVLELAADPSNPLLERVRFLAIVATNLDEFFMVRVAGLQRRIATGLGVPSPAGLAPREQLELIATRAHDLVARHAALYRDTILPALCEAEIEIAAYADLGSDERATGRHPFRGACLPGADATRG
jgi:polyphosphate kinase